MKQSISADPKLPHNSNYCLCPACDEYFNSVYAFDLHRIGTHGKDRGCMNMDQMLGKGMAVNNKGYWISKIKESGPGV